MARIKFGTDGWRGVIADDFIISNVFIVAKAIAEHVREFNIYKDLEEKIVIGHDTRFMGEIFAKKAVFTCERSGVSSFLITDYVATPVCAFAVVDGKFSGAIMFTASHNPYYYQGMKFIPYYGGPAFPEITADIEKRVNDFLNSDVGKETVASEGDVRHFDVSELKERYFDHLVKIIGDLKEISQKKVLLDTMHGTGGVYLGGILERYGISYDNLRPYPDAYFGGILPEPKADTLKDLSARCKEGELLGLATDGDADRFGIVDVDGQFYPANKILPLLYWYMLKSGYKGNVARTVATTHFLDIIAKKYGFKSFETPVGFKHLAKLMIDSKNNILLAGEESGGASIGSHIPEKDGILICMLVYKMWCGTQSSLGDLWKELCKEMNAEFFSLRKDFECSAEEKENLKGSIPSLEFDRFAGSDVVSVRKDDGLKLVLSDGSWVLIRPSGTENMIRIYAEANERKKIDLLIDEAKKLVFK